MKRTLFPTPQSRTQGEVFDNMITENSRITDYFLVHDPRSPPGSSTFKQ